MKLVATTLINAEGGIIPMSADILKGLRSMTRLPEFFINSESNAFSNYGLNEIQDKKGVLNAYYWREIEHHSQEGERGHDEKR